METDIEEKNKTLDRYNKEITITFILNNGNDDVVTKQNIYSSIIFPKNVTKDDFEIEGWYKGNLKIDPSKEIAIVDSTYELHWELNTLKAQLYYGEYPQSEITESSNYNVWFKLNSMIESLPNSMSSNGWTVLKVNHDSIQNNFRWYKDYILDGNKFRACYCTQYYNYDSYRSGYSIIENNYGYISSKVYWFKFDPILWNVVDYNGKQTLISDKVLFPCQYSSDEITTNGNLILDGACFKDNILYNYLNNDFLNCAFNSDEIKQLKKTTLKNDLSCYYNMYDYYPNNQKPYCRAYGDCDAIVFIPCYNIYSLIANSNISITDYSKCLNCSSYYWIRSPSCSPGATYCVLTNRTGNIEVINSSGKKKYQILCCEDCRSLTTGVLCSINI